MAPGPSGKVGQIVPFGADQDYVFVMKPSLEQFLAWYVQKLEAGKYQFAEGFLMHEYHSIFFTTKLFGVTPKY